MCRDYKTKQLRLRLRLRLRLMLSLRLKLNIFLFIVIMECGWNALFDKETRFSCKLKNIIKSVFVCIVWCCTIKNQKLNKN